MIFQVAPLTKCFEKLVDDELLLVFFLAGAVG